MAADADAAAGSSGAGGAAAAAPPDLAPTDEARRRTRARLDYSDMNAHGMGTCLMPACADKCAGLRVQAAQRPLLPRARTLTDRAGADPQRQRLRRRQLPLPPHLLRGRVRLLGRRGQRVGSQCRGATQGEIVAQPTGDSHRQAWVGEAGSSW